MTEILTESFCERCGTRYTFEAVEAKRKPLRGIGTLGRGIRHFVSDPGSSLEEALAVAKSEQEQVSTSHALEAFHRTFNFCLNCRQYTCGDCWNAVEGRCLTCAPNAATAAPETRHDTAVRLAATDLAPTPAPVRVEPAWPGAAETNGAGPHSDAVPPLLEPIDLAVARAEARAQAEAEDRAEARATAQANAEAAAAEEWERITAEALAAEEAERRAEEARVLAEQAAVAAARAQAEADQRAAEEAEAEARAAAQAEADAAALAAEEARATAEAERERAAATERAAAESRAAAEARAAEVADASARAEAERHRAFMFEPGKNLDDAIAAYEASLSPDDATPSSEPVANVVAEPIAAVEPEAETAVEPERIVATEPGVTAESVATAEPSAAEPVAAADPAAAAALDAPAEPAAAAEPEPAFADAVSPPLPQAAPFEPVASPVEASPVEASPVEALPVAAAAEAPQVRTEPTPTAVGQPLPASVVDGTLSWPEPATAAAPFEPAWPDASVPKRRVGAGVATPPQSAAPTSAHSCPGCGLSLSASARFCRRCGTPQQVEAVR